MREEEEEAMLTCTTRDRDREGDQIQPLKFPLCRLIPSKG